MAESRSADEQALIMIINQLHRTYRRLVDRALAVLALSAAQALPVIFISRLGDGIRQGVLADQLGIEGPSLVRQIDQLQEAGLVERRDDPADRRAKGLFLTPAGRELAGHTERLFLDLRQNMLSRVSDADLATCLRVLRQFEHSVLSALDSSPPSGKV
jgi:MarR family transcriptional regulator for hemolysin